FREGGYTALRVTGEHARHAIAFARRRGRDASITVVPRLMHGLGLQPGALPVGIVWDDARVELPFLEEGDVLRDAITGRELRVRVASSASIAASFFSKGFLASASRWRACASRRRSSRRFAAGRSIAAPSEATAVSSAEFGVRPRFW